VHIEQNDLNRNAVDEEDKDAQKFSYLQLTPPREWVKDSRKRDTETRHEGQILKDAVAWELWKQHSEKDLKEAHILRGKLKPADEDYVGYVDTIIMKKGFLERWLPIALGAFVALAGPLVAFGIVYIGVLMTLNLFATGTVLNLATGVMAGMNQLLLNSPLWMKMIALLTGTVGGIQHLCLEGKNSFKLLGKIGDKLDNWWTNPGFPSPLRFIPNFFIKIKRVFFPVKNPGPKTHQAGGWLRSMAGPIVSIVGPGGHAAEALFGIIMGVALVFGLTAVLGASSIVAIPTSLLVVAFIAAGVAMLDNTALEVPRAKRQIDKLDERLGWSEPDYSGFTPLYKTEPLKQRDNNARDNNPGTPDNNPNTRDNNPDESVTPPTNPPASSPSPLKTH